jgi:hypothetical protein
VCLYFQHIFWKELVIYDSINKELVNFQNSSSVLPRPCQGNGQRLSHFKCLSGQHDIASRVKCYLRVTCWNSLLKRVTGFSKTIFGRLWLKVLNCFVWLVWFRINRLVLHSVWRQALRRDGPCSLRWSIKSMRQTSSTLLCLSTYGLLLLLNLHHIEWLTDYRRRQTFRKAAQIIFYLT